MTDAYLNQSNPVSETWYPVVDAKNVMVFTVNAVLTWAVTQPDPLEIKLTVDGVARTVSFTNPVNDTWYAVAQDGRNGFLRLIAWAGAQYSGFLFMGRSVKVEVRVTWAVTQPTPLKCRVCYQKW